jgi:hypothetical protein
MCILPRPGSLPVINIEELYDSVCILSSAKAAIGAPHFPTMPNPRSGVAQQGFKMKLFKRLLKHRSPISCRAPRR